MKANFVFKQVSRRNLVFKNDFSSPSIDSCHAGLDLIRSITRLCDLNLQDGPVRSEALACINSYYKKNRKHAFEAHLVSPYVPRFLPRQTERRLVSVDDIHGAINRHHGLILEVHWYLFDEDRKKWTNDLGHYIFVNDYILPKRQLDPLRIKIVNPNVLYEFGPAGPQFDWVNLERISPFNKSLYAPNSEYIFRGKGFDKKNKIGILEAAIEFVTASKNP